VAVTAYLLVTLGAGAAAFRFARGDHLRRVWALVGFDHLCLVVGRLFWAHDLLTLPDDATTCGDGRPRVGPTDAAPVRSP